MGRGVAKHTCIEEFRLLGMRGEVVKEARAMDVSEGCLSGAHGMQQVAPRAPMRFVEQEQNGRPHRAGNACTQGLPYRGEGKSAWPNLVEHSYPRKG